MYHEPNCLALQVYFQEVKFAGKDKHFLDFIQCAKLFWIFPSNSDIAAHKFKSAFLCYGPEEIADQFFFENNGIIALQATSHGNQT